MDFLTDAASGLGIIFGDVLPNLGDVLRRKRMEGKAPLRVH
jgi:hypothetical protein